MARTRLVLLGGGHSHAIVLSLWAKQPLEGVELTLVSDRDLTAYSGMLPGYIAGFYDFGAAHIDLGFLSDRSGARFRPDRAVGLDLEKNRVIGEAGSLDFDYLSIDIGSTPEIDSTPGARENVIPAKPVPVFLEGWGKILERAKTYPDQPLSITIVGGGAGGIELAFNIDARLKTILSSPSLLTLSLIHRGNHLENDRTIGEKIEFLLRERGIRIYLGESPGEVRKNTIINRSGSLITGDYIIWVTSASAPDWIKTSGLATDAKGFIAVDNNLNSLSHPRVFAAGDIATIRDYPRPKAGVFAVRQGKPLFENLRAIVLGKPLKPYYPQKDYLRLLGTGDKRAIAIRNRFFWHSPLLWWWKDRIDRDFMERFAR